MNVTTVDFSNKNNLDQKVANIYERLQKIVKESLNCNLTYRSFVEPLKREQKAIQGLLRNNDPLMFSSRTLFPVYVDNVMTGYAEIDLGHPSAKTLTRVRQLVDLLLVRSVKNSQRIRAIRQVAKSYESASADGKNVVFLDNTSTFKHRIERMLLPNFEKSFDPEKLNLNFPILIQGFSTQDIFKMALEVHDHSNRYAFFNFDEIKDSTSLTVESLVDLGPVTLFVKDLEKLSGYQQLVLKRLIQRRKSSLSCPQVVAGIHRGLESIKTCESIDIELIHELQATQLVMKFEFKEYRQYGLKKYIYESLADLHR